MIIVNTTEKITRYAINENRFKLLMAVFVSAISIFIIIALYVYYMYINIRQLFKGIMAMSKGSYERRIRLLKTIFTPYEIVFLASEFNKMASEIHKSYIQLKEQNIKLEQLNEFRSNMIDAVSHEFRTPLTSIQGYTSRLLRQDIKIIFLTIKQVFVGTGTDAGKSTIEEELDKTDNCSKWYKISYTTFRYSKYC